MFSCGIEYYLSSSKGDCINSNKHQIRFASAIAYFMIQSMMIRQLKSKGGAFLHSMIPTTYMIIAMGLTVEVEIVLEPVTYFIAPQ